ncbi:MAG: response regulator transcription factor [Vulcanimicrobiota bacterium]
MLVVEDHPEFAGYLRDLLEDGGYRVMSADDGEKALDLLTSQAPQAVVLDLGLPRLGGAALLEKIRKITDIPVLVVTAASGNACFVEAFARGADDFLRKPFSPEELLVRLQARLRGRKRLVATSTQLGPLRVDWERAEVFRDGQQISLTAREFQLLRALYHHRNQVLTRSWLLEWVWEHKEVADDRLIDATVKRLRKKIGNDLVDTVRGVGFRLSSVAIL